MFAILILAAVIGFLILGPLGMLAGILIAGFWALVTKR
jgi:hypothetical protein